jgi:perosamine synthetase
MTEMSAALGVTQLRKVEGFLTKRARVAAFYDSLLADEPLVRTPQARKDVKSSYFVYVVELTFDADREEVMRRLADRGVPARGYFAPIHRQPYVEKLMRPCTLPVTESVGARTIALPFHNNLSQEEAAYVVRELKAALHELSSE